MYYKYASITISDFSIVILERDIDRLSAPGIFPKSLGQYNMEFKKEERSVARFVLERYKKLAHSIYDSAKEKGITPVAVKIFIPIFHYSFHFVQEIPVKLKQDFIKALWVFEICDVKLPVELQLCVLKEMVKLSRRAIFRLLDFRFKMLANDYGSEVRESKLSLALK